MSQSQEPFQEDQSPVQLISDESPDNPFQEQSTKKSSQRNSNIMQINQIEDVVERQSDIEVQEGQKNVNVQKEWREHSETVGTKNLNEHFKFAEETLNDQLINGDNPQVQSQLDVVDVNEADENEVYENEKYLEQENLNNHDVSDLQNEQNQIQSTHAVNSQVALANQKLREKKQFVDQELEKTYEVIEKQKEVLLNSKQVQVAQQKLDQTKKLMEEQQQLMNKKLNETTKKYEIEGAILMQNQQVASAVGVAQSKLNQQQQKLEQKQAEMKGKFNEVSNTLTKDKLVEHQKNLQNKVEQKLGQGNIKLEENKILRQMSETKEQIPSLNKTRSNTQEMLNSGGAILAGAAGLAIAANLAQISKKQTNKLLNQANIERKSHQFLVVKNWETYREQILSQHRKILELIFERFDKRIEISEKSMIHIIKYYQQRIDFEEGCMKFFQEQMQLGKLFKEQDDKIVHVYYPNYTKTLQLVDETSLQQSKNIENLKTFMKNQIRDTFDQESENFNKVVKDIRDLYQKQKKRVNEAQSTVNKQYQKYLRDYNETMNLQLREKKPVIDIYNQEKKYKEAVYNLLYAQREWGQMIMDKWNVLLQLETQRLTVLQKALSSLFFQYSVCYGKSPIIDQIETLILSLQPVEECEEFWSCRSVLKTQEQDWIKEQLQSQFLTIEIVRQYLSRLPLKDTDEKHPLVLKQVRCFKDVGHVGKSWKDIDFVVTVDNNVLIFDEPKPGVHRKADLKFKVYGISIKPRKNEKHDKNMVDFSYTVPGLLIDSKKKLLLKFNSQDEVEELNYFLKTIAQNNFQDEGDESDNLVFN